MSEACEAYAAQTLLVGIGGILVVFGAIWWLAWAVTKDAEDRRRKV